jgi:arsenite methyltransferase
MLRAMQTKPDYGIDAPKVFRNLWIGAILCLAIAPFLPPMVHFSANFAMNFRGMLLITGTICLAEALLFTLYVKFGKFKHRDFMLGIHLWQGDEQVLDVGCGRGLLLAGAAKHLTTGRATGIDIWSSVDMGGNSPDATKRNMSIEGVANRCTLVSVPAQDMTFADGSFDVIVSNLCLHNIYNSSQRTDALNQIARVLRPGGVAIISDFKHTGQYADFFARADLIVEKKRGSFLTTFPPLTVVIARKPLSA